MFKKLQRISKNFNLFPGFGIFQWLTGVKRKKIARPCPSPNAPGRIATSVCSSPSMSPSLAAAPGTLSLENKYSTGSRSAKAFVADGRKMVNFSS